MMKKTYLVAVAIPVIIVAAISGWNLFVEPSDPKTGEESKKQTVAGRDASRSERFDTAQNDLGDVDDEMWEKRGSQDPLFLSDGEMISDKTRKTISEFAQTVKNAGWDGMLSALEQGSLDLSEIDEQTRYKLARLAVSGTTPEQLQRMLGSGLLQPSDSAIYDVITASLKTADGDIDQSAIISKFEILAVHGYSLNYELHAIYGDRSVFDRAAAFGLEEVMTYLARRGVPSISEDGPWQGLLRSRFLSVEAAEVLLGLGYTPTSTDIAEVKQSDLKETQPEIYKLLLPYMGTA